MGRLNNKSAKRADGLYEVKVTVDHDFDGKPIRKSFYSSKSEKDARRKAEDYKVQLMIKKQTGQVVADNSFRSIVESLYSLKRKVVRPKTAASQKAIIVNHFYPVFENRKIANIKQKDIKDLFLSFGSKYSETTLKLWFSLLAEIFTFAIANDFLSKNPMPKKVITEVGREKSEKKAYTADQIKKVLDYCDNNSGQISLAVHFMLKYGLSRSETLGLTHTAIDLEQKTFSVVQGITVQNNRSAVTQPKNKHRKRVLPLFESTIELINKISFEDCDFIFSYESKMMVVGTFDYRYARWMKQMSDYYAAQGIDVPVLKAHELRHSRATAWVKEIEDAENLIAVLRALGWSSSKMVDVYAHTDVEYLRAAHLEE